MSAGVTTREIVKMLLQKGHKVTLVAPHTHMKGSSVDNYAGLQLKSSFFSIPSRIVRKSKLISMFNATLGCIALFFSVLKIVRREKSFDLAIAQYHVFHLVPLAAYFVCRLTGMPLVIKIHDVIPGSPGKKKTVFIYNRMLSKVNSMTLSHADCILSLSSEISALLVRYVNVQASRAVNFPNSVSLSAFNSNENVNYLRTHLGFDGKKIIMYIGAFFEDRGLEVLLKALRLVEDERVMLVVVGGCDRKYLELAKQLGVSQRVAFVGEIDHKCVPSYIQTADVCVGPLLARPYTYGAVPRKVIECMACGKPVVAARGTVTRDLAINGVSAVLVDSNNEMQVASAITSLVNHNVLSEGIGKRAKTIIAEKYNSEILSEKLHRMLKEILHAKIIND